MAIEFQCPKCQSRVQVPDAAAGKKGRCPSCQAKLLVPDIVPPPPPQPSLSIEFQCPRCEVFVRVPKEAAGKKGLCPNCQSKLRVPDAASIQEEPPLETLGMPIEPVGMEEQLVSLTQYTPGEPAEIHTSFEPASISISSPVAQLLRPKKLPTSAWLAPLICISILGGVLGWLLWKPASKLEGTLNGERMPDLGLKSAPIDPQLTKLSAGKLRALSEYVEVNPIRMHSQLIALEITAARSKLKVEVSAGSTTAFYRVDPKQNEVLWTYATKYADKYDAQRQKEMATAVPALVHELELIARKKTKSIDKLMEYRHTAGLNSLVNGLGYCLGAMQDGEVHRCVYEDSAGRLYFLLPKRVKHFELVGRDLPQGEKKFPGHYRVNVTEAMTADDGKSSKRDKKKKKTKDEVEEKEPGDKSNADDSETEMEDPPESDAKPKPKSKRPSKSKIKF